jgi:hypothetical protein
MAMYGRAYDLFSEKAVVTHVCLFAFIVLGIRYGLR